MNAPRTLLCLAFAVSALSALPAAAQGTDTVVLNLTPPPGASQAWGRPYLGLSVGRARSPAACASTTSMLCDERDRPTQMFAGTMIGSFWGAELGYLSAGRHLRDGSDSRVQGLNLSVVGRARLGSSFGVFGKVGTTYSRTDTPAMASMGPDQGFGLAWGGGLSYDFTPRLSARLEWDSNDLRFAGGRDPVRSTSLGLQYRY